MPSLTVYMSMSETVQNRSYFSFWSCTCNNVFLLFVQIGFMTDPSDPFDLKFRRLLLLLCSIKKNNVCFKQVRIQGVEDRPYFCLYIYEYGVYDHSNMSCFSVDRGNFCPVQALVLTFKISYNWLY